jgi:ATP-dependent helicase HrpA
VRRGLIPIAGTAAGFMEFMGAPSSNPERLALWLKEFRGVPGDPVRFDLATVPPHLTARLAVIQATGDGTGARPHGVPLAEGSDVGMLRRRCAAAARAELERLARTAHPAPWRRFEIDELEDITMVAVGGGDVPVHPCLTRRANTVEVGFEWSAPEAARRSREGAAYLARLMLHRQSRDLARSIGADSAFLLAASPHLEGDALLDWLLQLTFERACFRGAEPPRKRVHFEAAVEAGREHLYGALTEAMAAAQSWFAEAREVRRHLDDPRARRHADLAEETAAHLRRLLNPESFSMISTEWMRQVPRYIKAEARRWQRLLARGSEPPGVLGALQEWSGRAAALERQVGAELRWLQQLDELNAWIEEYRVSLYAQELRTLGPVSAARLRVRAADIDAWLTR